MGLTKGIGDVIFMLSCTIYINSLLRSNENLQLDDQRLMKLENESREARIKRKQLSQSLLSTQTGANDDLKSKYKPFKASMSMLVRKLEFLRSHPGLNLHRSPSMPASSPAPA